MFEIDIFYRKVVCTRGLLRRICRFYLDREVMFCVLFAGIPMDVEEKNRESVTLSPEKKERRLSLSLEYDTRYY